MIAKLSRISFDVSDSELLSILCSIVEMMAGVNRKSPSEFDYPPKTPKFALLDTDAHKWQMIF